MARIKKTTDVQKPQTVEIIVRYIVDRLSSGEKHGDVLAEIREKFKISEIEGLKLLNDSKDSIKAHMKIRVPFILSNHIERYEYLFGKFEVIGRIDLQNKCLAQKEELLKLKEALSERLTEDFNKKEIENRFMWHKLSKEKQSRVRQLLEKAIVS